MDKKTGFIIGGILIIFAAFVGFTVYQKEHAPVDYGDYKRQPLTEMSEQLNIDDYNPDSIIPADDNSGNLSETIEGNPDTAKVIIYEYADYACPHCAERNTDVNDLVEKYDGKVAMVFRAFVLNFNHSVKVASAAHAAAIQGYWKEYKDLIFANQNTWYYMSNANIDKYLVESFEKVSDGKGDTEKFQQDMKSEAVAKRIAFDLALGEKVGLEGTPLFRINGEKVSPTDLESKIEELLK